MSNSDSERHIDDELPDDGAVLMGRHNHTREDTRILQRAIREQWPIPDKYKEAIVNRQVQIAIDPNSTKREATSSARCLTAMNAQNVAAAHKALDKQAPDLIDVSISQAQSRQAILADPEYLAYREQKRLKAIVVTDSNSAQHNGTNGHSTNGHANGNGHA